MNLFGIGLLLLFTGEIRINQIVINNSVAKRTSVTLSAGDSHKAQFMIGDY